jgi:4-hydroxybenzoate polyprenyltransferase
VTTVLPIIISGVPWNFSFVLFALGRLFFVYGICILFDYRDREDDRVQGIRSLITILGEKGIDRLFWISLVLFFLSSCALSFYHYPAFYIFLLVIPGLVLGLVYGPAKRNFSDDLYYIVLDGLLMFSGLLMLIFRI